MEIQAPPPADSDFRMYLEALERQPVTLTVVESKQGIPMIEAFDYMMSDPHVAACYSTRRMAVVSRKWFVESSSPKISSFVANTLMAISNLEHHFGHLLKALPYGHAVLEVMWRIDPNAVRIDALRTRRYERFFMNGDRLMFIDTEDGFTAKPLAQRKFIFHRQTVNATPGLFLIFWPWWMKHNLLSGLQDDRKATLLDFCNRVITERILGNPPQLGKVGSYADARNACEVEESLVLRDMEALEETVNSTIIRWLVDFNYGPDKKAPRFSFVRTWK